MIHLREAMNRSPLKVETAFSSQSKSSFDSNDSAYLETFSANYSPNNPKFQSLERIINFLGEMPADISFEENNSNNEGGKQKKYQEYLQTLTDLTLQASNAYKDPSFLRILKAFGWTGTRYQMEKKLFDRQKFIQALSNIYLKFQYRNPISMENILMINDDDEEDGINHLEKIASFCPDIVVNFLENNPSILSTTSELTPPTYTFTGACMLADISGFSKFSAAMCSKGVRGLDELRKVTNGLLGQFVKSVYEHEGDVIAFAGDALICVFPDHKRNADELLEETTSLKSVNSTVRALHSASALRSVKFTELSTHIGISYGEMKLVLLGGTNGQWNYVVNGTCLSQLHECLEEASSQMVVITPECYETLMEVQAHNRNSDDGLFSNSYDEVELDYPTFEFSKVNEQSSNYKLDSVAQTTSFEEILNTNGRKSLISVVSKKKLSTTGINGLLSPNHKNDSHNTSNTSMNQESNHTLLKYVTSNLSDKPKRISSRSLSVKHLSINEIYSNNSSNYYGDHTSYRQFIESLTVFVPIPVITGLQTESNHQMGELRTVTTMFLCLDSYDPIKNADPSTLQPFFLVAQQALNDSGGFLRQFLIDDKGCVLIGMWGVPSFTYANNCARALFCATTIHKRIKKELDLDCSIGITTGSVFCGTVGAPERCDYVGIGSDVNLAARFMAKANQNIFVDESTYINLGEKNRSLLIPGQEFNFKGIPHPIRPYVYASEDFSSRQDVDSKIQMKGRLLKKHVMKLLDKQLDRMSNISPIISPADFRRSLVRAPKRRSLKVNVSTVLNNVQFTILVGQPGTGKSTAAHYFRIGARERGVQTVHLIAQSKHRNSPYSIIREFFLELVGSDNFKFPAQQANLLRNLISDAYPEYDYTDADRRHVKMVVEMVLGITSLLQEFSSPAAVPPKRITSLASSSRSPLLQRHQSTEQRMQELNLEIDEEFRFSAFQELIVSPSRLHSIRFQQLMQHRESRSSTLKTTGHFSISKSSSNDQNIEMNIPDQSLPPFSSKLAAENENQIFFKIIAVYLKNIPIAVIIENAHFCDELSWNALFLLLTGTNLDASVLLTIRSNPLQRLRSSVKSFHSALSSPKLIFHNGFSVKNAHSTSSPDLNKQQNQKGTMNPSTSKYSFNSLNSSQDIDQKMMNYALDHITVESFRSILAHTHCTVYEMRNLNEEEVKSFLIHKLKVTTISDELVKTVFNASSGNAYWCNMICDFIEEYGLHRLEMTTKSAHKQKSPSADSHDGALSGISVDDASESSAEDTEEGLNSNPVTASSDQTTILSSKKGENANSKKKKTFRQPSLSSIHTLRTLILYRFELLSSEYQTILKYASIIGSEFTPPLLHSILPAKLQDGSLSMEDIPVRKSQYGAIKGTRSDHFSADDIQMKTSFSNGNCSNHKRLRESLEHLERHGFLSCISEHPTYIYTFQNELIQRTVYELILPSDAALIHNQIAIYLEEEFAENLRPFYPSLAFHFKLGLDPQNAFKYEIKAAALAISSGAFNDGYKLAEASLDVFSNVVELDIVIQICTHAIQELQVILNSLGAKTPPVSEAPSTSVYQNTLQNTSQIIRNLSKSFFGFITGNGTVTYSSTASNNASVKASSANMPKAFYPFKGPPARTNSNLSEVSASAVVEENIDRVTKDNSFANDAPPSMYSSPIKKSVKINLDLDHSLNPNDNSLKLQIQPEYKESDSIYSLLNSPANTPKSALKNLSIHPDSSFNDSIFDLTPTQKTEVSIRQSQYSAFLTLKQKVEVMKAQIMKSPTKHPLPVRFYGGSSLNSPGLSSQGSTPGKYLNYFSTRDPTPNSPNTYGVNSDENSEVDLSQARNALNAPSNKFKITWKPSFVDQSTISPASRYFSNDLDELRFTFDPDDFKRPPPINIIPPSLQASSPENMKTTPLPFARFYHLKQTSNESTKGGLKVSPPSVTSVAKLEKQSSDEYFEYYRLSSDDSIPPRTSSKNKLASSPQYYDVGCQCIVS